MRHFKRFPSVWYGLRFFLGVFLLYLWRDMGILVTFWDHLMSALVLVAGIWTIYELGGENDRRRGSGD